MTLKRIGLILLALLVALVVMDLALWQFKPLYYPINVAAFEYDSELGERLKPGAHILTTTDFQMETRTNTLGTSNFQEDFNSYKRLVFAIGDSYTEGTGLPADMSYPSQLDLLLNQDEQGFYVKDFGVVNLGVAGYGGEQELLTIRRWTQRLRPPSFILYLGCDNDFGDDLLFRNGDRHRIVIAGSPVWGRLTPALRLVLEHSQIAIRLRALLLGGRRQEAFDEDVGESGKNVSVAELESPVLQKLVSRAREQHAVLVVSWSDAGDSYNWLKSWAADNNVPFADWAPKVDSVKAAIAELPLDNPHTGQHHRGWMNHVMAAEFARQIRTSGR